MKYNKITQKPYCCVGACIEMVLNRHQIKNDGQEQIAYQLGLTVPEEMRGYFKKARYGKRPNSGYGTQIQKEKYSLNRFFKRNDIYLKESYHYITDYHEAKKFLEENNDKDILIIFHCGTLYDSLQANWGHMVLFERIEQDKVTILEATEKRNIERVSLKKLLQAIQIHGKDNGAGFYLIEPM